MTTAPHSSHSTPRSPIGGVQAHSVGSSYPYIVAAVQPSADVPTVYGVQMPDGRFIAVGRPEAAVRRAQEYKDADGPLVITQEDYFNLICRSDARRPMPPHVVSGLARFHRDIGDTPRLKALVQFAQYRHMIEMEGQF